MIVPSILEGNNMSQTSVSHNNIFIVNSNSKSHKKSSSNKKCSHSKKGHMQHLPMSMTKRDRSADHLLYHNHRNSESSDSSHSSSGGFSNSQTSSSFLDSS